MAEPTDLTQSYFANGKFKLAYMDEGDGEPIVFIHGFASNHNVNWQAPGWISTVTRAGYRAIAFDHRGHGNSTKSHDPQDYTLENMADDCRALLDRLQVSRAHLVGYSMGARVAAVFAHRYPERTGALVIGGLGEGMVRGVGAWQAIADALRADDPGSIRDEDALAFRKFADQTKNDRLALAACIQKSRRLLDRDEIGSIRAPALVAVGTRDAIAGPPQPLADLFPDGRAFEIVNRDHMLSVGDRTFKARVLEFLKEHPI